MKLNFEELRNFMLVLQQKSLYHTKPRKTIIQRILDNLWYYRKEGVINIDYNKYGADICGVDSHNYLGNRNRYKSLKKLEKKNTYGKYMILTDDKYLFAVLCQQYDLPQALLYEYYDGRQYVKKYNNDFFKDKMPMIGKLITSYGGHGIKYIESAKDLDILRTTWKDKPYIIQEVLKNNKDIGNIYDGSLNTVRIVTFFNKNDFYVLSSIFRCGTSTTGKVDNISSGGLYVGINVDGTLMKYGYYNIYEKGKITKHPDTETVFEGYKLPLYDKVVSLALRAHSFFPFMPNIGWDIAVTENGVVLIEANFEWGSGVMQVCHGGIRDEWNALMRCWE